MARSTLFNLMQYAGRPPLACLTQANRQPLNLTLFTWHDTVLFAVDDGGVSFHERLSLHTTLPMHRYTIWST